MKEYEVKLTRQVFYTTTIKVKAETPLDAKDEATDLFFRDDGCYGIREAMEFDGQLLDVKVIE